VARFAYFGPSLEFINRLLPEKARAPTADTVQVVFNSPKGDPHMADTESSAPSNFIKTIIEEDLEKNTHGGAVATRFPPEPNGYLHIGHAKSICLNFGLARQYGGTCNLRFDDTNPTKEEVEYVDAIKADVRWLGFDWQDREFYASDYFEQLYGFAVRLIKDGKAYVDSLSADDIREYRGTFTEPGKESPYRDRSVDENLDLFERMRAGEFDDGAHVLRAKIDMAHPNLLMRDPTLYRIRNTRHHRTGDAWCIYPMYDFTHCLSDAWSASPTPSAPWNFKTTAPCTTGSWIKLEPPCRPRQYEFARLNLSYTVLSKRKLIQLVQEGHVSGWDDPRMPSISGFRRRGYTRRPSGRSATASGWPRPTAWWISPCWSTPSGKTSIAGRHGSWEC
jgi:glutaminyl-tRNA synthetase